MWRRTYITALLDASPFAAHWDLVPCRSDAAVSEICRGGSVGGAWRPGLHLEHWRPLPPVLIFSSLLLHGACNA